VNQPIAVIEPDPGGHRLLYVRLAVQAATGPVVLVTTRACLESHEYATHLADLAAAGRLTTAEVGGSPGTLRFTNRALLAAQGATGGHSPVVVIPEADGWLPSLCLHAIAHRRGLPRLRVLVMRTPRPWPVDGRSGRRAAVKALSARVLSVVWPSSTVLFLTDALGVVSSRPGYRHAQPLRDAAIALPVHDRSSARSGLDLPADAFVVGLLGDISKRKRPDLTIAALGSLPPTVHAVFAGRQDAVAARDLDAARGGPLAARIKVLDRYLDDDELGLVLSALDAVILTHDFDAPSGVLSAAIRHGVPVIAGGSPWLQTVVGQSGAGVTCDLTPSGVAAAISTVMRDPTAFDARLAAAALRLGDATFGAELLGSGKSAGKVVMLEGIASDYRAPLYRELVGLLNSAFVLGADTVAPSVEEAVAESGGRFEQLSALRVPITWRHPDGFADRTSVVLFTRSFSLLRRERPSVIVVTEMGLRTAQAVFYKLLHSSVRVIVWARLSERSEGGRSRLRLALRRAIARFGTAFVVNGSSGARYLGSLGVAADRVVVIPQVSAIEPITADELKTRKLGDGPTSLLYVGQLVQRKGVDLLIRAIADAPQSFRLRVIGDGVELDRLKALSRDLSVTAEFIGWIEDPAELRLEYLAADFFVLPTLVDEWGLVVVEALSQGTPVLGSTYSDAVVELVTDGSSGFTFAPDDTAQFAATLARAAAVDAADWRKLSGAAARSAAAITVPLTAERFRAVIRGDAGPGQGRS
jgi:glycosyltransferase involved in cell wall biosynthesis